MAIDQGHLLFSTFLVLNWFVSKLSTSSCLCSFSRAKRKHKTEKKKKKSCEIDANDKSKCETLPLLCHQTNNNNSNDNDNICSSSLNIPPENIKEEEEESKCQQWKICIGIQPYHHHHIGRLVGRWKCFHRNRGHCLYVNTSALMSISGSRCLTH